MQKHILTTGLALLAALVLVSNAYSGEPIVPNVVPPVVAPGPPIAPTRMPGEVGGSGTLYNPGQPPPGYYYSGPRYFQQYPTPRYEYTPTPGRLTPTPTYSYPR